MDYLQLLNALGRHVKPARNAFRAAGSLDETLADTGLDSLDTVLVAVYACEVFGIPEAVGKSLVPRTFGDIVRFVEQHASRKPASVDEALALVT